MQKEDDMIFEEQKRQWFRQSRRVIDMKNKTRPELQKKLRFVHFEGNMLDLLFFG